MKAPGVGRAEGMVESLMDEKEDWGAAVVDVL